MKLMYDKLALIVSIIASPFVVISVFAFISIAKYSQNQNQILAYGGTFFTLSILLPFLLIVYWVRIGKISDFHVSNRKQRTGPFLVSILSTILLLAIFQLEHAPRVLIVMIYALLANGVIFLIITQYWKASIHLVAFTGSVVLASFIIHPLFAYLLLLSPVVAWARIYRHRHSPLQTVVGALVSSFITAVIIRIGLKG